MVSGASHEFAEARRGSSMALLAALTPLKYFGSLYWLPAGGLDEQS